VKELDLEPVQSIWSGCPWGRYRFRCMAKKLRVETMDEEMEYLKFGETGLGVSRLRVGCMTSGIPNRGTHPWKLDEERASR
jgi:hypothetical protein